VVISLLISLVVIVLLVWTLVRPKKAEGGAEQNVTANPMA
jgi:hypothetical protein